MTLFKALEDIAPGQPITISYVDPELPRRARREELADKYLFECSCAACG